MRTSWHHAILSGLLMLAACGGGGEEPPAATVTARVSNDIPVATTSKIAMVVAPSGSSASISGLSLPATPSNIIVANDAEGEPLLLALDSADGVLSMQTTAIALVRIGAGLGVIPSGLTSIDLQQAISSTAHFRQLVTAIGASLQTGQSPSASQEVVEATWAVIDDVSASLKPTSGESGNVRSMATVEITNAPFYLVDNSRFTEQVWIEDANGGGVNLMNRSLLTWHVKSSNLQGAELTNDRAGPMEALDLPYFSTDYLSLYVSLPSITSLVIGNEANILFEQDDASRIKNILEIARQSRFALMSVLIKFAPKDADKAPYDCVQKIFETVINEKSTDLLAYPSGSAAMAYLKTLLQQATTTLVQCKFDPEKIIEDAARPHLSKAIQTVWSNLNLAAKITSIGMTGAQLTDFWRHSQLYHVCKTGGKIIACGAYEFKTRIISNTSDGSLFKCSTRDGANLSFQLLGSYEQCQSGAFVEVSCVGACAGRFYFNRDDVTESTTITRYFDGNILTQIPGATLCTAGTTTAHPFGPQTYTPGSNRWLPVNGPFIAAGFAPYNNSSFVRNVNVSLNPEYINNLQVSVCAASAQSYGVAIRIFDTLKNEYITVATNLSVP